VDII